MPAFRDQLSDIPLPAFSGARIDRVAALRDDPGWVAEQLRARPASAVVADRGGVLVDGPIGRMTLARRPLAGALGREADPSERILLGIQQGAAVFALDLEQLDDRARTDVLGGGRVISLREAGAELAQEEGGLAAYLAALLNWHRTHRFCANCGAPSTIVQAGLARRCPACGTVHFPRTDPVVIMLVEHADRLLLGRRAGWPADRYSVLAGFVAAGESAAEAVVREVREESGIEAYDPAFVTSQPWPFPASLMLGFDARADGGEPAASDGELEDVRWFPLRTVRAAVEDSGPLKLPTPISIARFLIERWVLAQR
jgi:NAD+ diphosphatase